jgi:hypothetical protein
MTRTITLIIGIAVTALAVAVPTALAKGQPAVSPRVAQLLLEKNGTVDRSIVGERFSQAPQWHQALMARSEGMNQKYGLGETTPVVVGERFQQAPQWQQALLVRSKAMNEKYQSEQSSPVVGERFQPAPQWQQALSARSEALNQQHQLGEYSVSSIDAREQALTAKYEAQMASTLAPDSFERAANAAIRDHREIVVDDRFRLDPTNVPTVTATSSGREIDFPQVGIGLGIGLLLAIGLYLAVRFTRIRPLAH